MVSKTPSLFKPGALALAIGSVALSSTVPVVAQTEDRRAVAIEEVVVTARRVEESLQDSPVSVAAFSTRDLEQMGVSEAGDVANFTPNLTMRKQSASQDNYAMAIRGVSSGETALAIDPTVGIYHDGVYIARSTGAAFDIVDLERIEVLRGPQGTLFGRNTIGGAINLITEKPRGEWAAKLQGSYGNRGKRRYQATIDTPTAVTGAGEFAAKISALRSVGDGLYKSTFTGGDLGQYSANAYRVALSWLPSEQVSVNYAFDQSRRDSNAQTQQISGVRDLHVTVGGAYYAAAQADADPNRRGKLPMQSSSGSETNSDIDGHALTVEWDVMPNLTIKSISSYREWHSQARSTEFGSFAAPNDGSLCDVTGYDPNTGTCFSGTPAPGTLVPIFFAQRESTQRQHSQELQFIGSAFDERLNYIAGLYYFKERAHEFNPQQIVLPASFVHGPGGAFQNIGKSLVIPLPFFDYATDNTSYAVFGEFTYSVTPNLDVSLGLRYTIDEKETTLTNNLKDVPGPASGSNPQSLRTVSDDDDWSNFNPSLTVSYRFSDEISTYAKVATGYRSGGYNVRSDNVQDFSSPFDEEHIVSYELGMKSDLWNRRLRLNAAVFHMQYDDRQIAQFSAGAGGASTNIVNAGKSEVSGLEIEGMLIPLPGLRLIANYGYLDVNYKKFITGRVDPDTGLPAPSANAGPDGNEDISGFANENLYAPEHNAAAAIEYEFAPFAFGTLALRADVTYTSDISFHPQFNNIDESDSHHLFNARATLSDIAVGDGRMKLVMWGRNLANKEYRDFGIDFGSLGFAINNYGELRSYGLDVVYEFNR